MSKISRKKDSIFECNFINTKNASKGFTLTEVIVVLVILAILAAILIPSLTKYISSAEEKTCQTSRAEMTRYYDLYRMSYQDTSFTDYLKENYGDPNSICPTHGKYTIKELDGAVSITCSKHDGGTLKDEAALDTLGGMVLTNQIMIDYFSGKPDGTSLNSEASAKDSWASKINAELAKLGVDNDNSSWRIYKDLYSNGDIKYSVYWCDTDVKNLKPGDKIDVIRYTIYNGVSSATEKGTCQVGVTHQSGTTDYNIIQANTFKNSK